MSTEPQASPPTPSPSQPSSPAATDKTIPGVYTTKLGRFGVLLLMGTLSWTIPAASYGTLTQALFAETDPDNKIWMVAVLATVSSIGGVLGVIFGGLLSDRTRSKWGKRKPWLLAGALLSGCSMAPIWFTTSFALLVALFTLCHVGVNVMVAALSALLPDRVDKKLLGRASALSGLGNLLGNAIGGVVASGFVPAPRLGLVLVDAGHRSGRDLRLPADHPQHGRGRHSLVDPQSAAPVGAARRP